jgi:flagellum-specific peptidoglycan hydrolase FlgJ
LYKYLNYIARTKNNNAMSLSRLFCRGWFCAVLCIILFAGNTAFAQRSVTRYVDNHKETAVKLMNETGIPASVILGVAMLESGSGTSKNAKLLHNHFGIVGKNKLHKIKGATYRSKYKEFASDDASYQYFVKLLSRKKWFPKVKGKPEYKLWLTHMNHGGYSSAGQEWVRRVTNMITKHKLYKLDEQMAYSSN